MTERGPRAPRARGTVCGLLLGRRLETVGALSLNQEEANWVPGAPPGLGVAPAPGADVSPEAKAEALLDP